jgi:hypothetical protein
MILNLQVATIANVHGWAGAAEAFLGMSPMGEKQNQPFHFSFHTSLEVGLQRSGITSDAGLLLSRELDERLGLGQIISDNQKNQPHGKNTQRPLSGTSFFSLPSTSGAV